MQIAGWIINAILYKSATQWPPNSIPTAWLIKNTIKKPNLFFNNSNPHPIICNDTCGEAPFFARNLLVCSAHKAALHTNKGLSRSV